MREVYVNVSVKELAQLIEMAEEVSQDLCHEINVSRPKGSPTTERRYKNETETAVELASLCAHFRDKYHGL